MKNIWLDVKFDWLGKLLILSQLFEWLEEIIKIEISR